MGEASDERPVAGDLDPGAFAVSTFSGRGFRQAYVRHGEGVPLLLVHGYPETKRIWWRVVGPLAEAGFEVIAPDLRAFGDSEPGPDGLHDTVASSLDLLALLDHLGHERAVLVGGDFGGAVVQDMAARAPARTHRVVLTNCPLPNLPAMAGLAPATPGAHDYFVRQGTDADALLAELRTPEERRRYVATFYTSRFWAHPGAFDAAAVAFHAEPFGDATRLRASWGCYEAVFDRAARTERPMLGEQPGTRALILFGPSDHVVSPDWDRMAALTFPDCVGPYLLRDVGHFVPWEAPGRFTRGVASFCADLLAGA
ncbi:MAG TPA: alpha/beta hydrolase [Acidimicrobiia bacterium]|nr:alpha/beta hydrolase [Acidimicrobiia bacterium]